MRYWCREDLVRDEFFQLLDKSDHSQLAVMNLDEGQTSGEFGTDRPQADQILIVLEGAGSARVGDQEVALAAGDVLWITAGEPHQIRGPNRTLSVYAPIAYPED